MSRIHSNTESKGKHETVEVDTLIVLAELMKLFDAPLCQSTLSVRILG